MLVTLLSSCVVLLFHAGRLLLLAYLKSKKTSHKKSIYSCDTHFVPITVVIRSSGSSAWVIGAILVFAMNIAVKGPLLIFGVHHSIHVKQYVLKLNYREIICKKEEFALFSHEFLFYIDLVLKHSNTFSTKFRPIFHVFAFDSSTVA